jgi:mitochondrial chaperone BCS1
MDVDNQVSETILSTLMQNQFLTGGGILMLLSAILYGARSLPVKIYDLLRRQFTVTVELHNEGEAYHWVKYWFSKHPYLTRSRRVIVNDQISKSGKVIGKKEGIKKGHYDEEDKKTDIALGPAPGYHFLRFNKKWLMVQCTRKEPTLDGNKLVSRIQESYKITYFGRSQKTVIRLLREAYNTAFPEEDPRITVYGESWGNWDTLASPRYRSLESVILPNNTAEELLADIKKFIASEEWYAERGVPYRRGYLLYGAPGTGKSSIVHALASELKRNIYIMKLEASRDIIELTKAMHNVPNDAILLLEDIDCLIPKREHSKESNAISMASLLNILDGLCASEGRLLFMTTNHIDKLDPALIRTGRVDRRIEFKGATKDQARNIYKRFFPEDKEGIEKFANSIPDDTPMSDLQSHLLRYSENRKKACHFTKLR